MWTLFTAHSNNLHYFDQSPGKMGGQTRLFTYCKLHEVQRRIREVTHYPTINSVELLVRTRSSSSGLWPVGPVERKASQASLTLGARGFSCAVSGFGQVSGPEAFSTGHFIKKRDLREKKWPARKASGPERHPFDSAEQITAPPIPKHPEAGCFADRFLGDVECVKCSDWITVTIGAWSGRRGFEGDKDQTQTIQAHIRYVYLTIFTDTAAILNLLEYYGMPRGHSR